MSLNECTFNNQKEFLIQCKGDAAHEYKNANTVEDAKKEMMFVLHTGCAIKNIADIYSFSYLFFSVILSKPNNITPTYL